MSLGPDDDRVPNEHRVETDPPRRTASVRGQVWRGALVASICVMLYKTGSGVLVPWVRPASAAAAVSSLLLGVYMLAGYAGGRVAARSGLDYDDGRSQWLMASVGATIAWLFDRALERVPGTTSLVRLAPHFGRNDSSHATWVGAFVVALGLIRFGLAMGTFGQARREGRVRDEDDADVE